MEAIMAEMLGNEVCDAVGSANREADTVPEFVFTLLGFEDVVVEAEKSISIRECEMEPKVYYLAMYCYD